MADNVAITAGSGTTIAADDVGGVLHQRVKLSLGADGVAADAPVGGGTEAGVLRVTVASDSTGLLSVDDNGGSLTVDDGGTTISVDDGGASLTVDGTVAVSSISSALPAGTNAIGKLAANSGVDIGDVDVTSVIPGTGASSLGKAEDAAHSSGDVGIMMLAVRKDSAASLAGTDGDYIPLTTDSDGLLRVTTAASGGTAGDVAHDTADSGNPVKVGATAASTNPTAVADGDRTNLRADLLGKLMIRAGSARALITQAYVQLITSNTSETTLLAAGGAGVFHDICTLTLTNSNTTTATVVTVRDATAGSAVLVIPLAARATVHLQYHVPFKQTTANNAWTIQQNAAGQVEATIQCEKVTA